MIDDTNSITNYKRYHTRDVHATVMTLSLERKQRLLEEIQLHKTTCNIMNKSYNHHDCTLIEELLTKENK